MRSQIAEGVLRLDLGNKIEVFSAGTHPSYVHPLALSALGELGVDTSEHRSKGVNEFLGEDIDLVITVCDHARETCPVLPGARKTIHKGYADPVHLSSGTYAEEVMGKLRDRMRRELKELVIKELNLPTD
jgi:arsenate reductase